MSQQFYDENEVPNVVEFELKDTELFQCGRCKITFVRLKAFTERLSGLWCTKCVKERKDILKASPVGVDFGQ